MLRTRRSTVGGALRPPALLLSLVLVVAACGGGDEPEAAPPDDATADGASADGDGRCGDPERLDDQLAFYNWADYIDEEILSDFEEECGVTVTLDTYSSNEEAMARIQAGNSGFDVLIPTDYAAGILAEGGHLKELDYENIPNAEDLDPQQLGLYYDEDNTYTLPYQYSTTGLAYDASAFDTAPDSYGVLFDENEHCGESSLLDDQRETIGMALVYLGYDWNETDEQAHEEATDLLLDAKDCVSAFDSVNFIGNLASGEVVVAGAWGFAAGLARIDNPDIEFVIPEEGGTIWQDNMVIPADAPRPYTAEVFINYLLEPDVGAKITEWTYGFTPNLAVEPLLSDEYHEVIEGGGIAIDDEVRERLVWQVRGPEHSIFADTYADVIAAG